MRGQITLVFASKYLFEVAEAITESAGFMYLERWSLTLTGDALTLTLPQSEHEFAKWITYHYSMLVDKREEDATADEEYFSHLPIAP